MDSILDHLALGNPLEEEPRVHTLWIPAGAHVGELATAVDLCR